jgi:tetratricopeptide (TPR) repeat protein
VQAGAPNLHVTERVTFARDIRPEVNNALQNAVACADDFERARAYLYQARSLDPDQLEVYVALYKFCFYRGRFDEAENIALEALARAADNGGFARDWTALDVSSTDWTRIDTTARLYLYSLKALGFIRLRKGDSAGASDVLQTLARLDPDDQVGGTVVMTLAASVADDESSPASDTLKQAAL